MPRPKTRREANREYYDNARAKAMRALEGMPPEKAAHFWRAFEWSQDVPMEHERPNVANMLYHGRGEEPALVARALAESGEHAETAARLLLAHHGISTQDILGHTRIPGAVEFLGRYPEAHQLIRQHGATGLRAAHRAIEWYEANRPENEAEMRGSFIDLGRQNADAVQRVAEHGLDALEGWRHPATPEHASLVNSLHHPFYTFPIVSNSSPAWILSKHAAVGNSLHHPFYTFQIPSIASFYTFRHLIPVNYS